MCSNLYYTACAKKLDEKRIKPKMSTISVSVLANALVEMEPTKNFDLSLDDAYSCTSHSASVLRMLNVIFTK